MNDQVFKVINERGYFVLNGDEYLRDIKVGEIIPSNWVIRASPNRRERDFIHSFYLMAETDLDDYKTQCEMMGVKAYDIDLRYPFFFRVGIRLQ
jgi:hypothetical protein